MAWVFFCPYFCAHCLKGPGHKNQASPTVLRYYFPLKKGGGGWSDISAVRRSDGKLTALSFAHLFTAEARAFVRQHAADEVRALALRAPRVAHLPALLHQIRARQLMADKLPTWVAHPNVVFPAALSLEQCSSEATARHKARLVAGHALADLTGGFGEDAYWLEQRFERVTYL